MNSIATFEKVSFSEYLAARTKGMKTVTKEQKAEIFEEWKSIRLPRRSTAGAAGYDFYMPYKVFIADNSTLIPTGIRAKIDEGWVLMIYPRSGLGTKYGLGLDNTVGIIDSDYYDADNEGHIMVKIHADYMFELNPGERFVQGVFVPYGVASNGNVDHARIGGFGSTGTM